jgi:Zn-dependent protease with chaperone function
MKKISASRTPAAWLGLLSVIRALGDKPVLARSPVQFRRATGFGRALASTLIIVVLLAAVASARQTRQQFSEAQLQLLERQLDETIAATPPEFFAHSEKEFDQFMKRYVSLVHTHARLEAYTRVNAVVKTLGKNSIVKILAAEPNYPGQIAFGRDGKVFLLDQSLAVLTDEELTALLAHELAHDQRDTNRRILIGASGNSLGECLQYNLLLRIEQRADEAAMSLLQQRGQNQDILVKLLRHMLDLNVLPKQEAQDRIQAASTTLPRIVALSK